MPVTFLVVPQWQGSDSSRAMRLIDGAEAIRGDLPASASHAVDVVAGAGESLGTGVRRFSALVTTKDRTDAVLRGTDGTIVTVGGDCASDLASVGHVVAARQPGSVALVWFDAHGDLNTAESSPSGAFSGMVVRAIVGDAPDGLAAEKGSRLAADHVILAGTRSLDDAESAFIDEAGIRMLSVNELDTAEDLIETIQATGATSVYLHIDLDVLDPATISGIANPEPFGLQPEQLCDIIRAVRRRFELAGAGICEFAPESPDAAGHDLPVILRILGALTAPLG